MVSAGLFIGMKMSTIIDPLQDMVYGMTIDVVPAENVTTCAEQNWTPAVTVNVGVTVLVGLAVLVIVGVAVGVAVNVGE